MTTHRYTARNGRVYDEDGREAGTARTAGGRDLEAHAAALELARQQRETMPRCPDCRGPWNPSPTEPACPACGLSLDDLEAAAAFLERKETTP